jgi:formylglycine-generating enzyme
MCLPGLMACGDASSEVTVTSDSVSKEKVTEIAQRIEQLYPKVDASLKHQILDVAVRAMENMLFIDGGSFMMGDFKAPCSPISTDKMDWTPEAQCFSSFGSSSTGAKDLHQVSLDSYSLSKYETVMFDFDTYQNLMGLPFTQSTSSGKPIVRGEDMYNRRMYMWKEGPARTKTWQQAKGYCQWLGTLTDTPIDLPTEAQWEYAARNRGEKVYYATNNGYLQREGGDFYDPILDVYFDYTEEEWNYGSGEANAVGSWPPNPLGLYDMTGNSWEWVNDWFSPDYYKSSPESNPQGPKTGTQKIRRGGQDGTTSYRGPRNPIQDGYYVGYGFRCGVQQSAPLLP